MRWEQLGERRVAALREALAGPSRAALAGALYDAAREVHAVRVTRSRLEDASDTLGDLATEYLPELDGPTRDAIGVVRDVLEHLAENLGDRL